MKKLLGLVIIFILISFLIPVIFTNKMKVAKEETVNLKPGKVNESTSISVHNYKEYARIKLLHYLSGEIEELALDEYLYGVVASEMPASFDIEALRAQAIVARTYTIYTVTNNKKHENADICDDPGCCQAWISKKERFEKWNEEEQKNNWKKIVESVNSTQGKIITYEGEAIEAFFHANSGGKTEEVIDVWGGNKLYPYISVVETVRRGCIFTVQLAKCDIKRRSNF